MLTTNHAFERQTEPQAWMRSEVDRLFTLRQLEGRDWSEIALALGRSESSVKSKYKYEIHSRLTEAPSLPFQREPIPQSVLAEQAKRLVAWGERTLTAAICGDPPIQYSALKSVNHSERR